MSPKVAEHELPVDEVVEALTSPLEGLSEDETTLEDQVQRAASDLDPAAALHCAVVLVDCAYEQEPDPGELEALVILGLAHPRVFRKYGLSLANEGRRLALVLEAEGRVERAGELLECLLQLHPDDREVQQDLASHMRRTGGVEEFIERCIQRAEEEATRGHFMEAISCLQEVLLHDQGRRDVARMIRDLRYAEMEARVRKRRRGRLALVILLIAAGIAGIVMRELQVRDQFTQIPVATYDDLISLRGRRAAIDDMIDRHKFWSGFFSAVDERSRLQRQIDALEARIAERNRDRMRQSEQQMAMAESARSRGREAAERGEMEAAMSEYRRALELSPPDWEHRERVAADVVAIENWLEEQDQ